MYLHTCATALAIFGASSQNAARESRRVLANLIRTSVSRGICADASLIHQPAKNLKKDKKDPVLPIHIGTNQSEDRYPYNDFNKRKKGLC